MAKLNVNIGLSVNDKTGDTLRSAFDKINQNFTELYTLTGGTGTALTELAQDYAAPLFNHASHTNITVTYDDANNKILLTGVASAVWPVANTAGASGPTKIAIGVNAGLTSQAAGAVAIGNIAGVTNQGQVAVAIGMNAGNQNQGGWATAVGSAAGYNAQGTYGVAVGYLSGYTGQGSYAVAVGAGSANGSQGANAVAVGYQAGNQNQGVQSIAIGANAGATSQAANTIILNATGSAVNGVAAQTNSFYVSPIRSATATSNVLYYNTTTKEITYAAAGSVSSLVNGARTLSLGSDGTVTLPNFDILAGIGSKIKSALDIKIQAGAYYLSNLGILYAEPFTLVFSISSAPDWATVVAVGDYVISGTCVMQITVVAAPDAGEWRITLSTTDFTGASDLNGNSSWSFYKPGATNSIWTFGKDGKLTAPGNLQVDGGKIILNTYGNAYVESVDYGVNSANSAVNIFGGPYQKIKLRAGFGTQATWTLGTDGSLTFPNATVQNTAYIAPTTGNSAIDSINQSTISRNGMTIRVTSAGMIQMSFNSVIGITGRSSINNADSVVIASPNGATVISTWYNIGAVLAVGDHLTATIVDASFHRIYRLTVTMRDKTTGPNSATAYAIIEQIQ